MKAAFLIRCSTKNQDLNRQTRDLTRLAKSMGYEYDLENLVYGEKITGKDDAPTGLIRYTLKDTHARFTEEKEHLPIRKSSIEDSLEIEDGQIIFKLD